MRTQKQLSLETYRAPHVATAEVVAMRGHPFAQRLYLAFSELNREHFAGKLAAPLVLITQANSSRTLGDYCAQDVHGLESRIRISPAAVKRGELFALDVLLHEMIHAWQVEVDGDGEDGYRGHGPKFAAKCNAIGEALGLGPVGVKGRGGLPDCAHWPMNVRPEGYYGQEFKKPTRKPSKPKAPPAPAPERAPLDAANEARRLMSALLDVLGELPGEALEVLATSVECELVRREEEGEPLASYADAAE